MIKVQAATRATARGAKSSARPSPKSEPLQGLSELSVRIIAAKRSEVP